MLRATKIILLRFFSKKTVNIIFAYLGALHWLQGYFSVKVPFPARNPLL